LNLENEHEEEIDHIKMHHREKKNDLEKLWKELEVEQKKRSDRLDDVKKLKDREFEALEDAKVKKKEAKEQLKRKDKQIELLQSEKKDNQDKLTKREKDLYKYKFKIKDLQKSKHVLTHRTTEMKESLQPKET